MGLGRGVPLPNRVGAWSVPPSRLAKKCRVYGKLILRKIIEINATRREGRGGERRRGLSVPRVPNLPLDHWLRPSASRATGPM